MWSDDLDNEGASAIQFVTVQTILPDVLIGGVTVDETAGTASFEVSLTSASAESITLTLTTSNGTAIEPDDYEATTATVSFAAGETQATFMVTIIDDFDEEPDETFIVKVQNVVDANIGWRALGALINFSGGSLIVELSNAADEFVIADAIRIERIGDLPSNESVDNLFVDFEESLMDDLLAVWGPAVGTDKL